MTVPPELLQYILTQERTGYTEQQIRSALLGQGYPIQTIEEAFKSLKKGGAADPIVHDYAQQYARQGYNPAQTFSALTQQGYPANTVRKAINDVYGPGALPQGHSVGFAVFFVLAILVGTGVFFLLPSDDTTIDAEEFPDTTGNVVIEKSTSEKIADILVVAQEQGKDPALKACQTRFRGEDKDLCFFNIAILPEVNDDKLCDHIVNIETRDSCLMNFIDTKYESVCSRVKLVSNKEICDTIKTLRG